MANTYKIIAQTNLTTTTASVTITGIDQNYRDLVLFYSAQTNYANPDDVIAVSYNGNTSSYYLVGFSSGSAVGYPTSASRNFLVCSGNSNANQYGSGELMINNYAATTFGKRGVSQSAAGGTTSTTQYVLANAWNNNSAITSITLTPSSGSFISGSNFYLYGIANS